MTFKSIRYIKPSYFSIEATIRSLIFMLLAPSEQHMSFPQQNKIRACLACKSVHRKLTIVISLLRKIQPDMCQFFSILRVKQGGKLMGFFYSFFSDQTNRFLWKKTRETHRFQRKKFIFWAVFHQTNRPLVSSDAHVATQIIRWDPQCCGQKRSSDNNQC